MQKDYDKKLFRLIKILNLINDSKATNTADLSTEFNISRRTAQRDISRLVSAGFPIIEDELHKGVYRFFEGYSLKGLAVSDQEVSLLVSLCEVAHHMGGEFERAYKSIFAKVMNTREWDSPFFVMMPKAAKAAANDGLMKSAQESIEGNRRIRFLYETAEGTKKTLVVDPLKLIYYEGYWYLAIRFPGQNWIIKYRMDRVRELEVLADCFKPPKSLKKILQDTQSIWFSEKRDKTIRIQVSADAAPFFDDRPYFPVQKVIKRKKDGSIILETTVCHYMEAIPVIHRWIPHLTVLSPKELSDKVKKTVSSYLKSL